MSNQSTTMVSVFWGHGLTYPQDNFFQPNAADPSFASYYKQARCTQLHGTKPIVFDVTIPNTVRNTVATQFDKFLF
jgi:hypothetical protein